jgi:hypothetical protein
MHSAQSQCFIQHFCSRSPFALHLCEHAALNGGAAAKLGSVNRAHIASAKQLASTATPLLRTRKGLRLRAVTPPDAEAASDEQKQEGEQQSDAPKLSLEDDDDEVLAHMQHRLFYVIILYLSCDALVNMQSPITCNTS